LQLHPRRLKLSSFLNQLIVLLPLVFLSRISFLLFLFRVGRGRGLPMSRHHRTNMVMDGGWACRDPLRPCSSVAHDSLQLQHNGCQRESGLHVSHGAEMHNCKGFERCSKVLRWVICHYLSLSRVTIVLSNSTISSYCFSNGAKLVQGFKFSVIFRPLASGYKLALVLHFLHLEHLQQF
jgi:hypothetical protein